MEEGVSRVERNWAMMAHLAALIGYVVPFGNILGPLAVWLAKREASQFVARHGRESLNFQLSIVTYAAVLLVILVTGLVAAIPGTGNGMPPPLVVTFFVFPVLLGLLLFNAVSVIVAGLRANQGQEFLYPLCIRYLS